MRRHSRKAVLLVLVAGTLWYLRDPAWLAGQTTGLRGWERGPDGSAYRWSSGHASFFVPADARRVRIPIATTFDSSGPRGFDPMLVTFTIDDVRAGRALLVDTQRHDVILEMPPRGSRRVRRLDLRTTVTREDNRGVKVGEIAISQDGMDWRRCCS